jgi:RNA-binding protein YhbY
MQKEYDAIITNMAKLLEVQQKRELVAVDMIAAAIAAEREACAKVCDAFQARDVGMQPAECAGAIRARGQA